MDELTPEQRKFLETKTAMDLDQAWSYIRDNLSTFIASFEALEELHPTESTVHPMFWGTIKRAMATAITQAFKNKLDIENDQLFHKTDESDGPQH